VRARLQFTAALWGNVRRTRHSFTLHAIRVAYLAPDGAQPSAGRMTQREALMTAPDLDRYNDRPEETASADVTLISRGVTVTAHVEVSDTYVVVVRPTSGGPGWDSADVRLGDPIELYWVGGQEERTLAGTVSQVEGGGDPRWHLAVSGQAERSQRRKAVRARVAVPVIIPWAGAQMTGHTVDLSESGMRALMDGWGVPLDPGTRSQASLDLGDALLHLHGEIVWTTIRGAQWLLAMKFDELPEKASDLLRRRVFQALRDERAAKGG
jgi:hypothetical protein